MEVSLDILVTNRDSYKTIDTLIVDVDYRSACYTLDSDAHRDIYIYLCNRYKVKCIKFVPRPFNVDMLGIFCSTFCRVGYLPFNAHAITVKRIIIEADDKIFLCRHLIKFVDRSRVTSIVCRLTDSLIIENYANLLNDIKSSLVKDTDCHLREIRFECPQDYRTSLVPTEGIIYSKYKGDGSGEKNTKYDIILARNMAVFRSKRSSIIALLAINKYKKKRDIHKDTILMLIQIVWKADIINWQN